MKAEDIARVVPAMVGIILFVLIIHDDIVLEQTPDNLWKCLAVVLGVMVLACCVMLGSCFRSMINYGERKKKGLRPEWHYEDMDEIEERIKKLEEKQ